MPKATLMVRFKRPTDKDWIRRPAVYGSIGWGVPSQAKFRDLKTREEWAEDIGENYTFDIRVEDGGTTYKPAGKNATDAEAKRTQIAAKLEARTKSEAVGYIVIDPAETEKKRVRLEDAFDDYIEDAFRRGAMGSESAGDPRQGGVAPFRPHHIHRRSQTREHHLL